MPAEAGPDDPGRGHALCRVPAGERIAPEAVPPICICGPMPAGGLSGPEPACFGRIPARREVHPAGRR